MKTLRLWSARHAGALERACDAFMRLAPHLRRPVALLGRQRAERWMVAHVPGVHIPEDIVRRLEQAGLLRPGDSGDAPA